MKTHLAIAVLFCACFSLFSLPKNHFTYKYSNLFRPGTSAKLSQQTSQTPSQIVAQAMRNSRTQGSFTPGQAAKWTGSTHSAAFTNTSMVIGQDNQDGWFCFDISTIPQGSIIDSVRFNGYVNSSAWPYWSLTPLTNNPLTASPASMYVDINAGATQSANCYVYRNESSQNINGWHSYNLGTMGTTDLQSALPQGWFGIGMVSRDNDPDYYVIWDGWQQSNPPYLTVYYSPPPPIMELSTGLVSPPTGNPATNFSFAVNYRQENGSAPTIAKVVIDGTDYDLQLPANNPDYTIWQALTYTTNMPIGQHSYYFTVQDSFSIATYPATAPDSLIAAPTVYQGFNGTLTVGPAAMYLNPQQCFDDLTLKGVESPVNVEISAGTYTGPFIIIGPVPNSSNTRMVNVYASAGTVVFDGNDNDFAEHSSSLWLYGTSDWHFKNITFTNGYQSGVMVEYSQNVQISHCHITANNWIGLGVYSSYNVWAWNNLIDNNATQQVGYYNCGDNYQLYLLNNTMYATGPQDAPFQYGLVLAGSSIVGLNNCIMQNWQDSAGSVIYLQDVSSAQNPTLHLDYNNYYGNNPSGLVTDAGGTANFTTLTAWQNASNLDTNSNWQDPLLHNPQTGNFAITSAASGCYQTGYPLVNPPVTDDYTGHTRSNSFDIGAIAIVPPPAVTSLNVSAINNRVNLSWPAVTGASRYFVYESNLVDSTYTLIGVTESTNYSATPADTLGYYKVTSDNTYPWPME